MKERPNCSHRERRKGLCKEVSVELRPRRYVKIRKDVRTFKATGAMALRQGEHAGQVHSGWGSPEWGGAGFPSRRTVALNLECRHIW